MSKEINELKFISDLVDRIDRLRVENGFSIYELASRSGVSVNTIKYVYKKQSFPNLGTIYNICDACEMPIWALFYSDNDDICLTKNNLKLISNYENLSDTSQKLLLSLSENLK